MFGLWGISWGDSWGTSWGPLYEVEEDEYRYYYSREKHTRHVRNIIKQEQRRRDDENILMMCLI